MLSFAAIIVIDYRYTRLPLLYICKHHRELFTHAIITFLFYCFLHEFQLYFMLVLNPKLPTHSGDVNLEESTLPSIDDDFQTPTVIQ